MSATMQLDKSCGQRLIALAVLAALASGPAAAQERAQVSSSLLDEKDAMLVRDWLEQESSRARRHIRDADTTSAASAVPTVELVAIYGLGRELGAELRIGGARHILFPEQGSGRATDRRGSDSIVAERIAGSCLSLRYRRTVRRLCLPAVIKPVSAPAPADGGTHNG